MSTYPASSNPVRGVLRPRRQAVDFALQNSRLNESQLDEVHGREYRRRHGADHGRDPTEPLSVLRCAFMQAAQQHDEDRPWKQRRIDPQEIARDIRADIHVRIPNTVDCAERSRLRRSEDRNDERDAGDDRRQDQDDELNHVPVASPSLVDIRLFVSFIGVRRAPLRSTATAATSRAE
jgi:hypothetical protein